MRRDIGLALLALLLGCAAGAVAKNTLGADEVEAPPATRDPVMWQQFCDNAETMDNVAALNQLLDHRGKQGWELVTVAPVKAGMGLVCYRRPAPAE